MNNRSRKILCPACNTGIPLEDADLLERSMDWDGGTWYTSFNCPRCNGVFCADINFKVVIEEPIEKYDFQMP